MDSTGAHGRERCEAVDRHKSRHTSGVTTSRPYASRNTDAVSVQQSTRPGPTPYP